MSIATALSVVQTILAALSCSELKELCSNSFTCIEFCCSNYVSDLGELKDVVLTIKKVLLDAEAKYIYEQPPLETQQYIEELSFSLYDADDLLDEFVTLAKQKHLLQKGKFIEKVRLFFSRYNQLTLAYRTSQGVKKIMTKLDGVASRHSKFGLSPDHSIPIKKRRYETCSYADTIIIGRDEDVEEIVGMLLHSDVSALTIVGMGGMGKTALAQLVYNHEKIKAEFPLRLWASVSDHDQSSNLDVLTILSQILESASGQKSNGCSMQVVVNRVREVLLGKRFLIVLDDLWTESRDELQKLLGHLVGGKIGSQIVVTTRSKETTKIMGHSRNYELRGLSDVYSWVLFRQIAFDKIDHEIPKGSYMEKLNIGKDIIKKCANVPLAIRVIGGILYRQDISKWREVQKFGLANLNKGEKDIKAILKLSYHNLESALKCCFSYCSVYPKDFPIYKDTLVRMWIAQGYVVALGKGQSLEDAADEYISVLLRRCFFQDVKHCDYYGEIYSFKLHDLMHDVALEVSNQEICPAVPYTIDMDKIVRHVSLIKEQYANFRLINAHIRTYLHADVGYRECSVDKLPVLSRLASYRCLRNLDLSDLEIKTLPASIGKLIHLRYLNLCGNDMEVLPNTITNLYNLQTLDLSHCRRLKELPMELGCMVNLRCVNLWGCYTLASMPSGMSKLNNLYELSMFVVRMGGSSLKQHAQLEDLKALKKLRGGISIVIHVPSSDVLATDNTITDGAYIRDQDHLDFIDFKCRHGESSEVASDYEEELLGAGDHEEELLGALQPHKNLKHLSLGGYQGVRMPRWAINDNLTCMLPNLVIFTLYNCCELECLPSLGKLQNLKALSLGNLPKLKTISVHDEVSGFFPCLEQLSLSELPILEWWGRSQERMGGDNSITGSHQPHQSSLVFSQLNYLDIGICPNLTSLPQCPNVKTLHLSDFNERLKITSNPTSCLKLNEVDIDNISWLYSLLPMESLTTLTLYENNEVESLGDFRQVFRACSSWVKSLGISSCGKLGSISGGLGYLTGLESLTLHVLPILNLVDEEIEADVECDYLPWGSLQHLDINWCEELKTFPKWMRKLTSLQRLNVKNCSKELYERCQNPNGEDWPNIQHIPCFKFDYEE